MLPQRIKIGVAAFLALSFALGANMLLMQPNGRGGAERASQPVSKPAQILAMSVGDPSATDAAGDDKRKASGKAGAAADKTGVAKTADASFPAEGVELIRQVQRELRSRGYEPGGQDGMPGLLTRAAVLAYEYDHGLPLTADPSERLLKQIQTRQGQLGGKPAAGTVAPPTAQAEQVIRTVQQSLANSNYAVGKIDGRLGEDTVRAIREFEIDQGMPETGRVSGQLVARLARLAGQGRLASGTEAAKRSH